MANYSLPEIADFLTTERLALHGVSPEVHAQNTVIVQHLGNVAVEAGEGVLAVQLFGSRAAGCSDLTSDIDVNVVATDEATRSRTVTQILDEMLAFAPNLDIDAARTISRIDDPIPTSLDEFTQWVVTDYGLHSIFGDGVAPSDNLRLTQLAALEVINKHIAPYDKQIVYDRIRADHAETFLGNLPRVQAKLAERLGRSILDVGSVVSKPVYQKRQKAFGMAPQFTGHHKGLSTWATQNRDSLRHLQAYDLYRTVADAV